MVWSKGKGAVLSSLSMLAITVISPPAAVGDEDRYQHSEAVMKVARRQCAEGIGNRAYCACVIDGLEMYLPPPYASIISVSHGKHRVFQIFALNPDTPGYIEDQLEDQASYCRQQFANASG